MVTLSAQEAKREIRRRRHAGQPVVHSVDRRGGAVCRRWCWPNPMEFFMKDAEDEAFDELAKRQGAWGGGFTAKRKMAADKLWDKPSVAFDEWWNGDNDESTNPYRLESGAYWAWAGWKAALAQSPQPAQKPFTYYNPVRDAIRPFPVDGDIPLYTTPPQRPWIGLTDEDIEKLFQSAAGADEETHVRFAKAIEIKLKERNHEH